MKWQFFISRHNFLDILTNYNLERASSDRECIALMKWQFDISRHNFLDIIGDMPFYDWLKYISLLTSNERVTRIFSSYAEAWLSDLYILGLFLHLALFWRWNGTSDG